VRRAQRFDGLAAQVHNILQRSLLGAVLSLIFPDQATLEALAKKWAP